jgi:hypothetical protein
LNAIKEILRLNGFEASRPVQSDKQELAAAFIGLLPQSQLDNDVDEVQ